MKHLLKNYLSSALVLGLTGSNLSAQDASPLGHLPLWFEAGSAAEYIAHGGNSEFAISATATKFVLKKSGGAIANGALKFVGANPAAILSGERELSGKINYLTGNQPALWRTGVPTFARLRVQNLYPGVDVVYYGNQEKLEYDFNLAPEANPADIVLRFDGAEKISVNNQNELVIQLTGGEIIQHAPVAYQTIASARHAVTAVYKILDANTATFALGSYNRSQPLVIDPVLSYSSYFGGNYGEIGRAIAVNPADGSIFIAGQTLSTQFTNNIPAGGFQTNNHGGSLTGDAFVAKFDNSGTNLIYLTYLGGSGDDGILGIAVDMNGNAYLTGFTASPDFPTNHAIYPHISGALDKYGKTYPVDAFVSELNTNGTGLIYSTYLGGSSMDAGWGISLDTVGNAFVAGYTYSTNFPVTTNAYQSHLQCTNTFYLNANAFVAEISVGGTNLQYSTFLGGTNFDTARAIAYNNNRLFVAGYTYSTNFPTTNNLSGFNSLNGSGNIFNPAEDVFVTAFTNVSGTNLTLLYSTLLGGTNNDQANGIAADAAGNAYVVGWTVSTNFPYTNVFGSSSSNSLSFVHTNILGLVGITNGFLTQIKWDGISTSIGYSVMFGGFGDDIATAIALSPNNDGNIFITGNATSTNFPMVNVTTNTGLSSTNSGLSDVFVMAFTNNASQIQILYSTYLGGSDNDYANAIAVDPQEAVYIVGQTASTNFPTVNPRQKSRNGTNDLFLAKITLNTNTITPHLIIAPKITSLSSAQPKIAGLSAPSEINLTWPWAPGYRVESSTNPQDTKGWSPVSLSPSLNNGWLGLSLPATNALQFYRLHHQ
jgi:Beta-propeller repeat